MGVKVTVYRTPLSSPQAFSLHGGRHPREAASKEHLCLEREIDDAGHETLFVRRAQGGDVLYRKATRWEAGRRAGEEEFFAETGATVVHDIAREGDAETERVLFDGELDSIIERTYRPDGTLSSERIRDAAGELTGLTERDPAGRVVRQLDRRSEQRFTYDPSGEIAQAVSIEGGEETVETTVFEGGEPTVTVISHGGTEIGRRTVEREGRRRVEQERRGGRVVLRRVEELDAGGRPISFEESAERGDGTLLETRRAQEYSGDGRLLRATVDAWVTVPGGGRLQAAAGRREMSWDSEGRLAEMLLHDARDEEFEDNSYYRFVYARGG